MESSNPHNNSDQSHKENNSKSDPKLHIGSSIEQTPSSQVIPPNFNYMIPAYPPGGIPFSYGPTQPMVIQGPNGMQMLIPAISQIPPMPSQFSSTNTLPVSMPIPGQFPIPPQEENKENPKNDRISNSPNHASSKKEVTKVEAPIVFTPAIAVPNVSAPSTEPRKIKERAKRDQIENRIYQCAKCYKSYLSYPALYTHTKLKHIHSGDISSITNGRMRGRPKKGKCPEDVDPGTPMLFREDGRKGGPTAVIYGFEDAFNIDYGEGKNTKYTKFADHPLYTHLIKIHLRLIKEVYYNDEHPEGFNEQGTLAKSPQEAVKVVPKLEDISSEQHVNSLDELDRKRCRCCDEVFAEYLSHAARKVKKSYYAELIKFVFLLRECVNASSEKLLEERKLLPPNLFPPNNEKDNADKDFCCTNNAEQVPDVCNDFILNFLEARKEKINLELDEIIKLMQNISQWMFVNGYTCSKIALIQQ